MKKRVFIAGTDTDVGKTYVSVRLLERLKQKGLSVQGFKPIASGATEKDTHGHWINEDAQALQQASTHHTPLSVINPWVAPRPIAPHYSIPLSIDTLSRVFSACLEEHPATFQLIEGAGGILCPLNDKETYADWVRAMGWPVILVIHLRVGCLNHAMLTEYYLEQQGIPCIGWIGNRGPKEELTLKENIAYLQNALHSPCLDLI